MRSKPGRGLAPTPPSRAASPRSATRRSRWRNASATSPDAGAGPRRRRDGRGMAATLASADLGAITFANRSLDRARALAEQVGGDVIALGARRCPRPDRRAADLHGRTVADGRPRRDGRGHGRRTAVHCSSSTSPYPATSIPPCALDGVTLFDMDDIGAFAEAGRVTRGGARQRSRRHRDRARPLPRAGIGSPGRSARRCLPQ